MNNDISLNNSNSGEGYLVVRVATASGAVPLVGAFVQIRGGEDSNADFYISTYSGSSGLTEKITLPAPSKNLSETPQNKIRPYALYSIDVSNDGYRDLFFVNVPIFDGITSVQGANMIPKPDNEYSDNFAPYDSQINEGENYEL